MVMNDENRQGRNQGDPDEQTESYQYCYLAPAATAQTTGEVPEALDGSCRAEGVVLRIRHYGSLPWARRSLTADYRGSATGATFVAQSA